MIIIAHKQFKDLCLYSLAIPEVSCAITLPHLRRVVVVFSSPYSNNRPVSYDFAAVLIYFLSTNILGEGVPVLLDVFSLLSLLLALV